MTEKEIRICYKEYSSIEELPASEQELVNASIEAMSGSYAPYSQFNVGAAIRLADGTIVKGANQENAAYPSGICAERSAMFNAGANFPDQPMLCLSVVASQNGQICEEAAAPCGACRQVMAQYQTKHRQNMAIILVGSKSILRFEKVDDILPFIFDNI